MRRLARGKCGHLDDDLTPNDSGKFVTAVNSAKIGCIMAVKAKLL